MLGRGGDRHAPQQQIHERKDLSSNIRDMLCRLQETCKQTDSLLIGYLYTGVSKLSFPTVISHAGMTDAMSESNVSTLLPNES